MRTWYEDHPMVHAAHVGAMIAFHVLGAIFFGGGIIIMRGFIDGAYGGTP